MARNKAKNSQVWIGLLEVKRRRNCEILTGSKGAFVNVLTWASNKAEFRQKATELTDSLELKLIAIENPQPFAERVKRWTVSRSIKNIAKRVQSNPKAIIYSTFHTWR